MRLAHLQRPAQSSRAIGDGAARGGNQPPVPDKTVVDTLIDSQLAWRACLFEPRCQPLAVVEQRVKAGLSASVE
jgi:hypothetical protein